MKYFLGNTFFLVLIAGALIWPLWAKTSLHWGAKTGLTVVSLFLAAFFVERVASRWVNRLVKLVFPDK